MVFKPSLKQQVIFFRQLHTYVKVGIPPLTYIPQIRQQLTSKSLKDALGRILTKLESGQALSDALLGEKGIFPDMFLSLVTLGERVGKLESITLLLADHLERTLTLRRQFFSKILYPVFLFLAALMILPLPMLFQSGLKAYMLVTIKPMSLIVFGAVILKLLFQHIPVMQHFWNGLKLHVPYSGAIEWRLALARFCRVYALTTEAGATLNQVTDYSIEAIPNVVIRNRFQQAFRNRQEEDPVKIMTSLLSDYPVVSSMLATGVHSGNVTEMMNKAAEYLEDEAKSLLDGALKIAPIILFLVVALYIGFKVIGFWSARYQNLPL
ncbi:type II secretion system F family protein [candidate division CSSED10-310 bacterium]|uniref:Type II secretion system F family protein n=1 Tax=candidate division CSSED10-310 bacterium TaxID=2855610 RepID=A0ABV6YWH0_UNCC1